MIAAVEEEELERKRAVEAAAEAEAREGTISFWREEAWLGDLFEPDDAEKYQKELEERFGEEAKGALEGLFADAELYEHAVYSQIKKNFFGQLLP